MNTYTNQLIRQIVENARQYATSFNPNSGYTFDQDKYDQEIIRLTVDQCIYNIVNAEGDMDYAIWKTKGDFDLL